MLWACIEVVVVGGEACFGEPSGLIVREHSCGHAGFHAHAPHTTHHLQHRFKLSAVANFSPSPSHAEPVCSSLLGGAGPLQHRLHPHLGFEARHIAAVVDRLRAVGAILFASAGLHAQQGGQLNAVARVGVPMNGLGLPQQIHQRQFQQRLDLFGGPVVTGRNGHVVIGSSPPKRRLRPW